MVAMGLKVMATQTNSGALWQESMLTHTALRLLIRIAFVGCSIAWCIFNPLTLLGSQDHSLSEDW